MLAELQARLNLRQLVAGLLRRLEARDALAPTILAPSDCQRSPRWRMEPFP